MREREEIFRGGVHFVVFLGEKERRERVRAEIKTGLWEKTCIRFLSRERTAWIGRRERRDATRSIVNVSRLHTHGERERRKRERRKRERGGERERGGPLQEIEMDFRNQSVRTRLSGCIEGEREARQNALGEKRKKYRREGAKFLLVLFWSQMGPFLS